MKENEITMIPVGQLAHHPDNPRIDLGDLTELAASIRANGILQNLTVVFEPEHQMSVHEWEHYSRFSLTDDSEAYKKMMKTKTIPDRYLVIIGNRRMEAAKEAGLTELPCSVREMDYKEQIATMLQENMQRADLTIYEQAKGIQMMMDLGFSKDQVSEKTGFSRSTIDRRLAVATLPEEETREAVDCGWDLTDLVEISKIEDPKKQKELLTDTAPGQLKQAIEVAKKEQIRERNKKRLMPEIERLKMKPLQKDSDRWSSRYEDIHSMRIHLDDDSAEIKVPAEYEGKTIYYYITWGDIEFYAAAKKEKHVKTEAEIAREKKQHDAKELNDRMRERRIAYVASWKPSRMQESNLKAKLWPYIFDNVSPYSNGNFRWAYHDWDSNLFRNLCGMPKEEDRDKDETIYAEMARRGIPLGRAILAWILCGGVKADGRKGYASEYSGDYAKDEDMDRVYEILTDNGYQMTEEEQQWKDGTHPSYRAEGGKADERTDPAGDGADR